jgi:hypothetical protein
MKNEEDQRCAGDKDEDKKPKDEDHKRQKMKTKSIEGKDHRR